MSVAYEFSHDWVSSIGIRRRERFLSPLKDELRPLLGIETYQNRSRAQGKHLRGQDATAQSRPLANIAE
jgi:hypothetical protein